MKKIIILLLTAILFTVIGCLANNKNNSQSKQITWNSAYKTKIHEIMSSKEYSEDLSYPAFSLYDISCDGVPELIVSYNYLDSSGVHIYTFKNKIIDLGEIGQNGRIVYSLDTNDFASFGFTNSTEDEDIVTYKINGHEIVGEKCDLNYEEYIKKNTKTLGRDFIFHDSMIDMALTTESNWSKLYSELLLGMAQSWEKKDTAGFSLCDINDDDIPELFISEDSCHAASVNIYSVDNGLIGLGTMGSYGTVLFNKDKNVISSYDIHQGFEHDFLYSLNSEYIWEKKASFYNNRGAAKLDELVEYMVNEEKVSYEEYQKQEQLFSGDYLSLGLDFKFESEDIENAISKYN